MPLSGPLGPDATRASRSTVQLASALLLAVLAACGGGGDTPAGGGTPPAPTVTRLVLGAAPDSLAEAEDRALVVTATSADGRTIGSPALVWTSSDTTIVTVSAQGVARGVRPGRATVRVTSGSASAEQPLRVTPALVVDVRIRGADSVVVGTSAPLVAEPRDPTGRPLLGRTATWSVRDTTIARIGADGVVRGVGVGRTEIVATIGTITGTRPVIVRPPFARSLAITRVPDTLWTSVRDTLRATFTDSAGQTVADDRPVTWSSDDPRIVDVEPRTGVIRPIAVGTTTLRASGDRLVAARQVTVLQAPVARIVAAPDTITVLRGLGAQWYPILLDLGGQRVFRRAFRFASDNPAVATISASGVVNGVTLGETTVRITSERATGTAVVRVIDPGARFKVELRFIDEAAPQFREAFELGVARWEQAILRGGDPITASFPANVCGVGEPARTETIRDLVIYVRLFNIDGPGGVLGSAGACLVRSASGIPLVGVMQFDTTDLRGLFRQGTLQSVVTHEIGHVLGVSASTWNRPPRQLAPNVNTAIDPRFVGRRAVLASAGLGFTLPSEGVPLETTGGGGTRGSHWREETFTTELMTGFANPGLNPMSILTIESLADIGYQVTTTAADPFGRLLENPLTATALADRLPTLLRAGVTPTPVHARELAPAGEVGSDARVRLFRAPARR